MTANPQIITLILLMGLVTAVTRLLPYWLPKPKKSIRGMTEFLHIVPIALIAALLFPDVFLVNGELLFSKENVFLMAAIPTTVTAILSKNIGVTTLVGVICSAALLQFLQLF